MKNPAYVIAILCLIACVTPAVPAQAATWKVECQEGQIRTHQTHTYSCLVTTQQRTVYRKASCPRDFQLSDDDYSGANFSCKSQLRGRTSYEKYNCPRGYSINNNAQELDHTCSRVEPSTQVTRAPYLKQLN